MRPSLLLCVLLVACSTTPPAEYRQGAFRPVPPRFSPSTDAPHTVGQPGHLAPSQPQRSPHKRPLPPSKEPGLWAGDAPHAAANDDAEPIVLIGVPLPPVYIEKNGELEPTPTAECAKRWQGVLPTTQLGKYINAMTVPMRRCLAAHMFYWCAEVNHRLYERLRQEQVISMRGRAVIPDFFMQADAFLRQQCPSQPMLPERERKWFDDAAVRFVESMQKESKQ
jgi:hypothetical protein